MLVVFLLAAVTRSVRELGPLVAGGFPAPSNRRCSEQVGRALLAGAHRSRFADRGLFPDPPPRVDVVVIPVGKELAGAARELTGLLRNKGLKAETPYSPAGVGKDLKAASRDRASFAVIVGPDEWSERAANLKDLRSGEERRVSIEALADAIRDA